MDLIKNAITSDRLLGFDQFGQLMAVSKAHDSEYSSARIVPNLTSAKCAICGGGWEVSAASFLNHVSMQEPFGYAHRTCYKKHLAINEYDTVVKMVRETGHSFRLSQEPNQYEKDGEPWHKVSLVFFKPTIIIGWRRRVREITLTGQGFSDDFFPKIVNEDATKRITDTSVMIHAWSDKLAELFLGEMGEAIRLKKHLVPFVVSDDYGEFIHAETSHQAANAVVKVVEKRGPTHHIKIFKGGYRLSSGEKLWGSYHEDDLAGIIEKAQVSDRFEPAKTHDE